MPGQRRRQKTNTTGRAHRPFIYTPGVGFLSLPVNGDPGCSIFPRFPPPFLRTTTRGGRKQGRQEKLRENTVKEGEKRSVSVPTGGLRAPGWAGEGGGGAGRAAMGWTAPTPPPRQVEEQPAAGRSPSPPGLPARAKHPLPGFIIPLGVIFFGEGRFSLSAFLIYYFSAFSSLWSGLLCFSSSPGPPALRY